MKGNMSNDNTWSYDVDSSHKVSEEIQSCRHLTCLKPRPFIARRIVDPNELIPATVEYVELEPPSHTIRLDNTADVYYSSSLSHRPRSRASRLTSQRKVSEPPRIGSASHSHPSVSNSRVTLTQPQGFKTRPWSSDQTAPSVAPKQFRQLLSRSSSAHTQFVLKSATSSSTRCATCKNDSAKSAALQETFDSAVAQDASDTQRSLDRMTSSRRRHCRDIHTLTTGGRDFKTFDQSTRSKRNEEAFRHWLAEVARRKKGVISEKEIQEEAEAWKTRRQEIKAILNPLAFEAWLSKKSISMSDDKETLTSTLSNSTSSIRKVQLQQRLLQRHGTGTANRSWIGEGRYEIGSTDPTPVPPPDPSAYMYAYQVHSRRREWAEQRTELREARPDESGHPRRDAGTIIFADAPRGTSRACIGAVTAAGTGTRTNQSMDTVTGTGTVTGKWTNMGKGTGTGTLVGKGTRTKTGIGTRTSIEGRTDEIRRIRRKMILNGVTYDDWLTLKELERCANHES